MVHAFTALKSAKNLGLFVKAIRRNDDGNRFADDLGGRVTKQPLRTNVPAANDAVQVFADDSILRRINNSAQQGGCPRGLLALVDIDDRADVPDEGAFGIETGPTGIHGPAIIPVRM